MKRAQKLIKLVNQLLLTVIGIDFFHHIRHQPVFLLVADNASLQDVLNAPVIPIGEIVQVKSEFMTKLKIQQVQKRLLQHQDIFVYVMKQFFSCLQFIFEFPVHVAGFSNDLSPNPNIFSHNLLLKI